MYDYSISLQSFLVKIVLSEMPGVGNCCQPELLGLKGLREETETYRISWSLAGAWILEATASGPHSAIEPLEPRARLMAWRTRLI